MNSIEEYQNLVELLKTTLKFYADKRNYPVKTSNVSSPIEVDNGFQAQFAINKVKELEELNEKMQEDYDKFMAGYEQLQASEETADPQKLLEVFKIIGSGDKNV